MPRLKEITAEDDSLDPCSPATDKEAIPPHQFQAFKKTEYDSLHLSPGKSVLKVLWDRVSAEIAQRSGHTVQQNVYSQAVNKICQPKRSDQSFIQTVTPAVTGTSAARFRNYTFVCTINRYTFSLVSPTAGVKGSLSVKKAWSPPATHYEEYPVSRQRLRGEDQKPTERVPWERLGTVTEHKTVAEAQAGLPAVEKGRDEPEQLSTGSDPEATPSLAGGQPTQMVWNRVSNTIDQKDIAHQQDDNISCTGSKEEQNEIEAEKKSDNISLNKSNPEHLRQLAEDLKSSEKLQNQGTEDRISSKTEDSTSDFAPKGEQEDQDSVEEKVTTYDALTKEQLEEDAAASVDPNCLVKNRTSSFAKQDISCRLTDYLEERTLFREEKERNQYTAFTMDSQQTGLPREKIQEDVKPRHTIHEDVPRPKTMDFLPCISDDDTKAAGSEDEEVGEGGEVVEVPYLSYNPPEPARAASQEEAAGATAPGAVAPEAEPQPITREEKIKALRMELESLERYEEEGGGCLLDEESLPAGVAAAEGRAYVMPDPVRARLDEELLLYHVPRSPEAPRRFSDRVFFRFKVLAAYAGCARHPRV